MEYVKENGENVFDKNDTNTKIKKAYRNYKIGALFSSNRCKQTRLVQDSLKKMLYIMKIMKFNCDDPNIKLKIIHDMTILESLNHPNIPKLIENYRGNKKSIIVLELLKGGNLKKFADSRDKPIMEIEIVQIMFQILSAVNYCHKNDITHLNLTMEHVIFEKKLVEGEEKILKVIDFGLNPYFYVLEKLNEKHTTQYYIAPEVIKNNFTKKCDIWPCGVIFYYLLFKEFPFQAQNTKDILVKILKGVYDLQRDSDKSRSYDAIDLLIKMLKYNPTERFDAYNCLKHRFFRRNGLKFESEGSDSIDFEEDVIMEDKTINNIDRNTHLVDFFKGKSSYDQFNAKYLEEFQIPNAKIRPRSLAIELGKQSKNK